jgi:hypothetical protein
MQYTLGQAAKATGKSKSVIQRAILKGKISAVRDEFQQYVIESSELFRVFPFSVPETGEKNESEHAKNTGLLIENAQLKARLEAMGELNRQIEAERDNLREQNTRITALLSAPKADPYAAILERLEAIEAQAKAEEPQESEIAPTVKKSGFWRRIMGG